MKQIFFLLSGLIGTASCMEQSGSGATEALSDDHKNTPSLISTHQPVVAGKSFQHTLPDDPTFIETKDTVSKYGPHSITRNILQDKSGNLWFATWQGIMRYDGKLFTNMTLKEGLGHFHVFSILEDRSGNLWFGTIGGGLYRYDGKAFTYFTTKDGLIDNTIMCMMEDNAGNIWFGTGNGLSCYSGHVFTNFTTANGLLHNTVFSMLQDRNGKLWFGTEGGVNGCYPSLLNSYGNGKASSVIFIKEEQLFFRHVLSMIEDKSGKLWVGSQAGLSCYDGKTVTHVRKDFSPNVIEDRTGNLWVSGSEPNHSYMSLYRYNGTSFREIKRDIQIFGIMEDSAGNIWFGTMNGTYRYNGSSFTNFREG